MMENDFNNKINEITKRARQEKKRELAEEKMRVRENDKQRLDKAEPKENAKQQMNTTYTAVIVTKLEYGGDSAPSRGQLAEELGSTIMKWVNQKSFYAIDSKEPGPKLISVDVDIK
jgi:outer membrane biosynthesis protein TonB